MEFCIFKFPKGKRATERINTKRRMITKLLLGDLSAFIYYTCYIYAGNPAVFIITVNQIITVIVYLIVAYGFIVFLREKKVWFPITFLALVTLSITVSVLLEGVKKVLTIVFKVTYLVGIRVGTAGYILP
jgi:hypothetical protein